MEEKKCGTVKRSRSCDSPERKQGSREKKYKFSKTERTRFVSRKSRPGFSDEIFNETSYYFRNGKTNISIYIHTYITHGLQMSLFLISIRSTLCSSILFHF